MADEERHATTKDEEITQATSLESPSGSAINESGAHGNDKRRNVLQRYLGVVAEQWFLLALGALIAFASQVQVPLRHQEMKRTLTSYICISLIFFMHVLLLGALHLWYILLTPHCRTGCTIDTKVLLHNYTRWRVHLYTQSMCFLATSLIVFALVSAIATNTTFLDPGLLVGLIFFSCVATTISSNVVMTRQAHGNTALTVVETTVGNLIGVFITPALIVGFTRVGAWYDSVLPPASGDWGGIYRRVLKQLGLSIYLPLVIGQATRYFLPRACEKVFVKWKGNKIGSICLLVLLWATYDQAFATQAFERVPGSNMVFIVFISVALWLVFFGLTFASSIFWLAREDVISLCMCVPAKGIVMGVPLSTTVFAGIDLGLQSRIQIPIVVYQGLQLAFASLLVPVFRRWVDRGKSTARREEIENR